MAHPNKSKLWKMVRQAGGKANFSRILPVKAGIRIVVDAALVGNTGSVTKPAKAETIAKWEKRLGAK